MATDKKTIESLERINEAIKILCKERETLRRHLARQRLQPSGQ